jgi:hypothetical protein
MQTRKALKALSNGEVQYDGSPVGPLAEHAERFVAAYDEREQRIVEAKNRDTVLQPVLDVLRRKVASVAGEQDRATPVAMRFDAFQAIKTAAETSKDRGLAHLARHLEQMWHKDPMGSITLGEVSDLRAHYAANYPKSKIAKVMESEIYKVGYNTLPIAQLVRIASQITDQADYDAVIVRANLQGDKPNQVRARTLIRELVALRGTETVEKQASVDDDRSNIERVSDRIAQEMLHPPVAPPEEGVLDAPLNDMLPAEPVMDLGAPGEPGESAEGELGDLGELIQQVNEEGQELMPQFPGAEEYVTKELGEGHSAQPPSTEWAFEEGQEKGPNGQPLHSAPPPSKEWQTEELAEHGKNPAALDGPGIPDAEDFVEQHMAMKQAGFKLSAERQNKIPTGWKLTVEKMAGMPNLADPKMLAWFMMDKGYQPVKATKTASGMDAPKPKTQPGASRPNNYAPNRGKDGGSELKKNETKKKALNLTASQIETALLDRGEVVKVGQVSLHINDQDEVELWVRDAGRACSLGNLDFAIADFLKYADEEINPRLDKRGAFTVIDLVPVPCARCAAVEHYEPMNDGFYGCVCGHRTRAAAVATMVKHGQLQMSHVVRMDLPAHVNGDNIEVAANNVLAKAIKPYVREARINGVDGNSVEFWLTAPRKGGLADMIKHLAHIGFVQVGMEQLAQLDAGSVTAPGSADAPMAQDVKQQTVRAPGKGGADPAQTEDPASHQEPDIASSFAHYRSMGIGFIEAIAQFKKDFPEWVENHSTPEFDAQIISLGQQLYTSGGANPAGVAATPDTGTPAPGTAPAPAPMQATAFKNPSVKAQQPDQVQVGKQPLGPGKEDGAGHPGSMKQPAIKVKHPAKQKSPTDMGKTNEDGHPSGLSAPKPPKDGHVPGKAGDQPGTKAPSKGMHGKDSDNDPAKSIPVPGKFGPRPK